MKITARFDALLLLLLASFATVSAAQSLPEAGRNLLKRHDRSLWVVDVQLRQTLTWGEQSGQQEANATTTGVLLDVGNLIAVPLSLLEPANLIRASNPQAGQMLIESEIVTVKVQLPEGGELPATVVYRDKDLDLAFVQTKDPLPKDAVPIRLTHAGKPGVLDTVITLNRDTGLGKRVITLNAGYIQAVLDKPLAAYCYELASVSAAGCPVFMPDGKFVGLILLNFSSATQADGSESIKVVPLVISAETIREAAMQAEAARNKAAPPAK